jgi:hypothetical protein
MVFVSPAVTTARSVAQMGAISIMAYGIRQLPDVRCRWTFKKRALQLFGIKNSSQFPHKEGGNRASKRPLLQNEFSFSKMRRFAAIKRTYTQVFIDTIDPVFFYVYSRHVKLLFGFFKKKVSDAAFNILFKLLK